uniref:Uncharacterized protein n=1 Tax=Sipha flava TaxID=143950 RepID=A0A2S2R2I8_9HEMI
MYAFTYGTRVSRVFRIRRDYRLSRGFRAGCFFFQITSLKRTVVAVCEKPSFPTTLTKTILPLLYTTLSLSYRCCRCRSSSRTNPVNICKTCTATGNGLRARRRMLNRSEDKEYALHIVHYSYTARVRAGHA